MAHRATTTASGASGTPSVAVPAGAAANDICSLKVNFDRGSGTITWPANFDLITPIVLRCTAEGQTTAIAFKRLTAGDTGTYDLSFTGGATDWVAQASLFSGRDTTNPPEVTTATQNTLQASPVTINGASITAVAGDDLEWCSGLDVNGSGIVVGPDNQTVPSSPAFTERQDTENAWANLCTATLDNVSAGATGTLAGSVLLNSGACGYNVITVRYPAATDTPVVNTNTLTSTVAVADEGLDYVLYNRRLESFTTVFDELIASLLLSGNTINTKVLEDFLTVTDGAVASSIRMRLLQDTIILSEGTAEQYVTTNLLMDDPIDVTDDLLRFARFFRVASDTLTIFDAAITQVGNAFIISSVLTSNLLVTDEMLKTAYFYRVLDSLLRVVDEDAMPQLTRFILLSDALLVNDGAIATYIPDGTTPGQTFDPIIRIGFDQPRIDIGGRAVG